MRDRIHIFYKPLTGSILEIAGTWAVPVLGANVSERIAKSCRGRVVLADVEALVPGSSHFKGDIVVLYSARFELSPLAQGIVDRVPIAMYNELIPILVSYRLSVDGRTGVGRLSRRALACRRGGQRTSLGDRRNGRSDVRRYGCDRICDSRVNCRPGTECR